MTHLVLALLVIALVQAFFVKMYQIPSASMEQTLLPGDRILANRFAYVGEEPQNGDVVVFERPDGWKEGAGERSALRTAVGWFGDVFGFGPSNSDALVKRVLAGPGDTIGCCDAEGRVVRNGEPLDESAYVAHDRPFVPGESDCDVEGSSARCFPAVTVPEGHYLVLGDNRASSADSVRLCRGLAEDDEAASCARLVPREEIVGKVFFVLLPFSRWGTEFS